MCHVPCATNRLMTGIIVVHRSHTPWLTDWLTDWQTRLGQLFFTDPPEEIFVHRTFNAEAFERSFTTIFDYIWSIFGPVMAGQRSNFRKFYDFSTLLDHICKTIYRSGMGPSPACSSFNSAQNELLWCISVEYLGRIVLIDDAVSHPWRHRSDLWRHGSVTWHAHMNGISTTET